MARPDVLILSNRDKNNFHSNFIPEPNTGCWLWSGFLDKDGYGLTWVYPENYSGCSLRSNRLSYILHKGQIPKNMLVLHSCDTPACVNPDHLRVGTPLDNMQDKMKRNRHHWKGITHCPKGHPYSGANLKMNGKSRACRLCSNELQRRKKYWNKK